MFRKFGLVYRIVCTASFAYSSWYLGGNKSPKLYGNQMFTTPQKIKSDQLNSYVSFSFFNVQFNIILIRACICHVQSFLQFFR